MSDLDTFEQAMRVVARGGADGVGYVFTVEERANPPDDLDVGVAEHVTRDDVRYFREHPDALVRDREYVPGEGLGIAAKMRAIWDELDAKGGKLIATAQVQIAQPTPGVFMRRVWVAFEKA